MAQEQIKTLEISGIDRHRTKIGVEDGCSDDLVNLRFMDGSWRASGDGKLVWSMTGIRYEQLFIHTNVYRHLLGVAPDTNNNNEPTLWWFASIETDGETFVPLQAGNSTSTDEFISTLPDAPVALTTVHGDDLWISQTGHLLTVIDGEDDFEHFVFKTSTNEYKEVNVDVNGKATDRGIYPFGQVHFNLYEPTLEDEINTLKHRGSSGDNKDIYETDHFAELTITDINLNDFGNSDFIDYLISIGFIQGQTGEETFFNGYAQRALSYINVIQSIADEKNIFTRPFFVVAALRLYDGSYIYASQPVLLNPREIPNLDKEHFTINYKQVVTESGADLATEMYDENYRKMYAKTGAESFVYMPVRIPAFSVQNGIYNNVYDRLSGVSRSSWGVRTTDIVPAFYNGFQTENGGSSVEHDTYKVAGSDIVISFGKEFKNLDRSTFTHLAIFVSKQADVYDFSSIGTSWIYRRPYGSGEQVPPKEISYIPKQREFGKIIDDLIYSPLFLLKEISIEEVGEAFHITPSMIGDGVLKNIVQQDRLPIESSSRTTYLPKVSYMYNNRLHIANYKTHPFFGYPIDLFHLHNHSVKVQEGSWFPNDTDKKVLPNLTDNNDSYLQYAKAHTNINTYSDLIAEHAPYFIVKVTIETSQGEQVVTRYIEAYDTTTPVLGRANFIEDLNPLLTYPDARAKQMTIYYVTGYYTNANTAPTGGTGVYVKKKDFALKPHPYLNMAYYIDPELKPIQLSSFEDYSVSTSLTPVI